jgi:hypothetical protein
VDKSEAGDHEYPPEWQMKADQNMAQFKRSVLDLWSRAIGA